jgi:hypothetical protein
MARMVRKPKPAAEPVTRTVTWDPVSKRNYWLQIWLTLGAVALIIVGALIDKRVPAVGHTLMILGLVIGLVFRGFRRTLLPYTLPSVTYSGPVRSRPLKVALITVGIIVAAIALFCLIPAPHH